MRAALIAFDHRGNGDPAGVPDAGEVHADDLVPLRLLGREAARADAGVGQHDVGGSELRCPVVEGFLQGVDIADIGLRGEDAASQRLDFLDRLIEVVLRRHRIHDGFQLREDVDPDDVGAFLCQPHRMAATLAARDPGDEGDLAVELSHGSPSVRRGRVSRRTAAGFPSRARSRSRTGRPSPSRRPRWGSG